MKNSKNPNGLHGKKLNSVQIKCENVLLLYNKEWLIGVPKTKNAIAFWLKNISWDTAVWGNPKWFNIYNEKGNVFIIRHQHKNESYLFNIETKEFYDYQNVKMDALTFFTEHKSAFNLIFDHLKTFDRQKEFMDALV